jgi:hypothetical protein
MNSRSGGRHATLLHEDGRDLVDRRVGLLDHDRAECVGHVVADWRPIAAAWLPRGESARLAMKSEDAIHRRASNTDCLGDVFIRATLASQPNDRLSDPLIDRRVHAPLEIMNAGSVQ